MLNTVHLQVVPLPKLFYQLFTIFAQVGPYVFPVCFALMTKRTTELYAVVFQKMRELAPTFAPIAVMADYELAPATAIRVAFGAHVRVVGCWFHYAQAILKKVRAIGAAERFMKDLSAKDAVHCIMALPLLPPDCIADALGQIETSFAADVNNEQLMSAVTPLCEYVRTFWIRKIGTQRLSVYGERDRTNSAVESFHAKLARLVKVAHPSFYVLLDHLQRICVMELADAEAFQQGRKIRRPKKKSYLLQDAQVALCVARFERHEYNAMQFLQAVSHSVATFPLSAAEDADLPAPAPEAGESVGTMSHAVVHDLPAPAETAPQSPELLPTSVVSRTLSALSQAGHANAALADVAVAASPKLPMRPSDGELSSSPIFRSRRRRAPRQ